MQEILYVLLPLVLIIVNEYHQNKIFTFFGNFYYYSKYIILLLPFVLIYLNPNLLKKILIFYKDIDNKPVYQNMNDLMVSYFDTKKNNKMKFNLNGIRNDNTSYYNNVPNFRSNNMNNQTNMNYQNNMNNQKNMNNNNFINKPNRKVKRNVSESKKKFIASNQKWRCSHCQNLLDNTYEVDHIIALYRGGTNDLNNLEALCRNCHGKKTFREKMGLQ